MATHGPPSAHIGEPPLTQDDFYIVRGKLLFRGALKFLDPAKGIPLVGITRPPPGEYKAESYEKSYIAGASVCMFLMMTVTGTRLGLRMWNKSLRFGWDDWFVLLGTFFAIAVSALYIPFTMYGGAGHHMYDVTYWNLNAFSLISFGQVLAFYWSITTVKISIVCFYMRLSAFSSRNWNRFHWSFIGVLAAYLMTCTFSVIFLCDRPSFVWNARQAGKDLKTSRCRNSVNVLLGLNVVEILSDVVLMVVPIMMLWKTQLKFSAKLRVWLVGLVGIANIVAAIGRTVMNFVPPGPDVTYTFHHHFGFTQAEVTIGVVTASLPVLSSLVTRGIKRLVRSAPQSQRHGRYVFDRKQRGNPFVRHGDGSLGVGFTKTSVTTSSGQSDPEALNATRTQSSEWHVDGDTELLDGRENAATELRIPDREMAGVNHHYGDKAV